MTSGVLSPEDLRKRGVLQLAAGITLMVKSELVVWEDDKCRFGTALESVFERAAAKEDLLFGRLLKWMQFSGGFEFLLKGTLLVNGTDIIGTKMILPILLYAEASSDAWVNAVCANELEKAPQDTYGTLGTLTFRADRQQVRTPSVLDVFLASQRSQHDAQLRDCNRVFAVCELLRDGIRNRDAHAYVPNVRKQQGELVHLFVPALNSLLEWVRDDALLHAHRKEAAAVISSLSDDPITEENLRCETSKLARKQSPRDPT